MGIHSERRRIKCTQLGLLDAGPFQLSAVVHYRSAAYQENDSDSLTGMGNRDASLMAGAGLKTDLLAGMRVSITILHDALNRIGGSELSLFLDRSFQWGPVRLTPQAGVNWTSARLANHDYGVPASKAIPGRPAYDTGNTLSTGTGIRALAELTENWWLAASLGVEFLSADVRESPIVNDSVLVQGFLAVQYVF